ncbi:MAG TPA: hypothetical protein VGR40_12305 [Candidatus Binatus sp.]|nr:hypothetical protein [Candidatus Binatus sp.]
MNAKPLAFKRHFLSCLVNPKVFIAYNEEIAKGDTDYRDITKYDAAEIHWDIGESDVNEINGDGLCGLALSAIEGACYASTEYLLCGLPVVSTESVGGRDAYYDSENAVMVAASPQDVMRGVSTVLARRDEFDRWAIHRRAVARSREFQHSLAEALAAATSGSAGQFVSLIEDAVCNDNKLWAHRNFWVRELLRPDATERFASRARSR